MKYPDGSSYEGGYKMDKRHGQGVYTYTNGDTYAGGWANGVKHGKGCYFFTATKCQFLGYWEAANFTAGTVCPACMSSRLPAVSTSSLCARWFQWVFKDGTTYVGTFEGGPKGPGTYVFPNGSSTVSIACTSGCLAAAPLLKLAALPLRAERKPRRIWLQAERPVSTSEEDRQVHQRQLGSFAGKHWRH